MTKMTLQRTEVSRISLRTTSNSSFLRHRDDLHAAAKDEEESSMSAAAKSVMRAGNEEP